MQEITKAIINLLKIKSLVTLAVISVFCVLSLRGVIDYKDFMIVQSSIITYYFMKKDSDKND